MIVAFIVCAPLFLAFEVAQLIVGERYLGIKQIARHGDPRELRLGETLAFCWTASLFVYWAWMLALLLEPMSRMHGLSFLAVSGLGFAFRRNTTLKWTLVILTFEGAVRVGLLVSLFAMAWRRL